MNTVNTVGVMGKGIALQFAERYKENLRVYQAACKSRALVPGTMLVVRDHDMQGERIIVNFPTKKDYKHKSKYEYIETGLVALAAAIKEHGIRSIAVPPLGCGNGGLDWDVVKPMIQLHLNALDTDVVVYEPSVHVRDTLREVPTRDAKLTPARTLLLSALYQYERNGGFSNLFVANKLAYFLQRMGDTSLRLKFEAARYGLYTDAIGHMLYNLNGAFLTGLEQKAARPFDDIQLNYARKADIDKDLKPEQHMRLDRLRALIDGFHATADLELLSSVSFILEKKPSATAEQVVEAMAQWSKRKEDLAEPAKVAMAMQHLQEHERSGALF